MLKRWFTNGIAAMLLALLAVGCGMDNRKGSAVNPAQTGSPRERDLEEDTSRITIETAGQSVELQGPQSGWPEEIPAGIPRYPGPVDSVTRRESSESIAWTLDVPTLDAVAMKRYEAELKALGFDTSSMIAGNEGSVTGDSGGLSVVLMTDGRSSTITIVRKR